VKHSKLKQIIKEEIKRILKEDLQNTPLDQIEPGQYLINYITAGSDGGPDMEEENIVTITQSDLDRDSDMIPSNFWRGEANGVSRFRIYKVIRVTKV
jgi:hypothetical protein